MTSPAPGAASRTDGSPMFDGMFWLSVVAVVGAVVRAMAFTPVEAAQGAAQKIYYVHVPAAMSAYLALGIAAVMSVVYLWLRDERSDRMAEASVEVGMVFTTGVLLTGPLWGKPIWGAWWTGDARQNLTLFLWFITVGYLVLRGAVDDVGMRARYSAVLAVLAALLIPFIHLSVYLFRTMHPMPIVLKPSQPSLPNNMLLTWVIAVLAFAFFCITLIRARYRLSLLRTGGAR